MEWPGTVRYEAISEEHIFTSAPTGVYNVQILYHNMLAVPSHAFVVAHTLLISFNLASDRGLITHLNGLGWLQKSYHGSAGSPSTAKQKINTITHRIDAS